MDVSDTRRTTRHRGLALLLALFYGVLTGASLAPVPVEAQPSAAAFTKRAVLAPAATGGRAAIKSQRQAPDPIILPPLAREVRTFVLLPVSEQATVSRRLDATSGGAPYRARAPPAA
ncbi:hypothetical protein GGQ97_000014 [Sphingomonas kaistensis]|uniref:Uncharacterized protein n=1 Tax=Sphingomonas kaistensis TaxID=298708 RepID=A0A7X6BFN7_9SPHN|nr:hypothetical protein [Sphingomonas kaistensis]NJC04221.1 hypothetical protein [Sphingomonas kaistensis]